MAESVVRKLFAFPPALAAAIEEAARSAGLSETELVRRILAEALGK